MTEQNMNGDNDLSKLALSVAEVSRLLGLSEDLTRSEIDKADDPLPSFRAGRRILVSRVLLEEWIIRRSGGHIGDTAPSVVTSLPQKD